MKGYIDARQEGVPPTISGNICIIGAGAAGITLARKLARSVSDIILVEAGGLDIEGKTQSLFSGRQLGLQYFDLASCRLRYFGGTTNHWSGFCRVNDPVDYVGRSEVGLPAWPISHTDLAPYVSEAGRSLGIEPRGFEPASVLEDHGEDPSQLIDRLSQNLQTKIFQLAPDLRLGKIYRQEIGGSPNIRAYLNLNLTHIQLDENATHVKHLSAATLTGRQYKIVARHYVLCCHAIENARLLLTSNDVARSGIGNRHDHVGRYFMEHLGVHASRFIPTGRFPRIYNFLYSRENRLNANISFSDAFIQREKLLQYYCRFTPHYASQRAIDAAKNAGSEFWQPGSLEYLRDIATVASELGGVAQYAMSRKRFFYSQPAFFSLEHRTEQAPNPSSRVVISERKDALGQQIADLNWCITDADVDTIKRGQAAIGRELAVLGLGRLEEEVITRELVESRVEGHYHQIGTTRMSSSPAAGVVDSNGKVHGLANLHIGGSSVFPTAGYSGPTMMIIALALRQAEYLKPLAHQ